MARAFWEHAVTYGLAASLFATGAAFSAIAFGLPGSAALAIHLLPLPYIVACMVGVYRSAREYDGPRVWARAAEVFVAVWGPLLIDI